MQKSTIAQAKQIDLVDYLASLGHYPKKIRNQDHWCLSPLQDFGLVKNRVQIIYGH